MKRPVLFTGDIFRLQARGGITRYTLELIPRLSREREVLLGLHVSAEASRLGRWGRAGLRIPAVRGAARLAAPLNRLLAAAWLRRGGVTLHPTYYRDPRSLPSSAPLVVTVHDMTHERFPELLGPNRGPERHKAGLCARAARLLCYSEATRRDLVELLGVSESRIRVTPLAARDWSQSPGEPLPGVEWPFVLWVGPRHAYKNFERGLRAWAGSGAAAGTHLVCVGGASLRRSERALLGALGVSSRVHRHEASDGQLRWAYERAECLLYPSLWEGFGLPVVEAMALGCPVVTSSRSSLPEAGGEAADYADPEDLDSLHAALERCLAAGRGATRAAALRAQAARFSWDACAALHEAVYQELD